MPPRNKPVLRKENKTTCAYAPLRSLSLSLLRTSRIRRPGTANERRTGEAATKERRPCCRDRRRG
ncbi:hypothetical protein BHE74_00038152 [Ensete ventricosum]|nr:hypothetical protein BHE74_00038152 [Ensete ventricosum]RZS04732.1 hypothetical protein BHM03_00035106 [Ensete ventricosum]